MHETNVYFTSLIAGGTAGLTVDVTLYPLDTIKTRLQSPQGFLKAGGFAGIYKGLGPQTIGSVPTAALFFCTYESFKKFATPYFSPQYVSIVHMIAASIGEVVACGIRVPVEVIKQRRQTSKNSSTSILLQTVRNEGIFRGLYRGFGTTVTREIPFAFIQFPIYEYFKVVCGKLLNNKTSIPSYQVAICGALAGGIAAAVTTPLDVAKTRIMLAEKRVSFWTVITMVYQEKGFQGLFAGFVPRVMWITIGGAIFFGAYDVSKNFTSKYIFTIDNQQLSQLNAE